VLAAIKAICAGTRKRGKIAGVHTDGAKTAIRRFAEGCDSPSVLPGDIRSVSAAPVTVSETVRRTLILLVADMVRLLCFGTLHNAALSCHAPEADRRVGSRDEHVRLGAVCRLRRR
jgi:hypothetical protein